MAASAALLWAALPPLDLWPLAWLSPLPLALVICRRELPGQRPYLKIWLVGFAFWLATLYWLTLPHWATAFGWVALCFYLAAYWSLVVALSRVAVHRLGISVVLAAPLVWTGLELLRALLLSGFMMAGLSHTQHRWLGVIQISDLGGAYAVSFLIMLVGACAARTLPWDGRRLTLWPLVPAAIALAAALGYGHWRMSGDYSRPGPKVALIQGSIDTEIKSDPNEGRTIFDEYVGLSKRAISENKDLDLMVWPETMFRYPWFEAVAGFEPAEKMDRSPQELALSSRQEIKGLVEHIGGVPMLIGIDTILYTPHGIKHYNSAVFTNHEGHVYGRYDKMHPVMFGEYVPLATTFPWLYKLTPLGGGLDAGSSSQSFTIGKARYAANICYESTVPHLIASQVRQLRAAGKEPDVLVNLTNDGWFWGSSELDMHLACGVFRAVETRKPFLIAANTGFSAAITADGKILSQGPRRQTGIVVAETPLDSRRSWYLENGDWPAGVCLAGCAALAVVGLVNRGRRDLKGEETMA